MGRDTIAPYAAERQRNHEHLRRKTSTPWRDFPLNESRASYRRILRSSSIVGAASAINIVMQIARVKVLAVLLGPSGMGLIGMYSSILATASGLAGLGIGTSAVRQIAGARGEGDEGLVGQMVQAMRLATVLLAFVGAGAVFLFREPISVATFGDPDRAAAVGWLAIGVFVSVAGASVHALLQGYRRIGDQARVQVLSGLASTIVGIAVILYLGESGVIIFVVAAPVATLVIAWFYAQRIPVARVIADLQTIRNQIVQMVKLGFLIMLTGALQGWALLFLRSRITQDLSLEATGVFQAAWAISFIYIGLVFEAMGRDYFPRLTEVSEDREASRDLINEQMHVALILSAPFLIGMMAFAPLIVQILYTESFRSAVPIIRWMVMGNLLKVVVVPIGYILLARGESRLFIWTELLWVGSFFLMAWFGIPRLGVAAPGLAFCLSYCLYSTVIYVVAKRMFTYSVRGQNLRIAAALVVTCTAIFLLSTLSPLACYVAGFLAVLVATWLAHDQLVMMLGRSPISLVLDRLRRG